MYRRQHSAIQFLFVALGAFVLLSVPSVSGGRLSKPWLEIQRVQGADLFPGSAFGFSVALDGGRALVGAPAISFGPGAAYVFVRQGDVWIEEQKLVASDVLSRRDAGSLRGTPWRSRATPRWWAPTSPTSTATRIRERPTSTSASAACGSSSRSSPPRTVRTGSLRRGRGARGRGHPHGSLLSDDIGANLGQGSVYVFGRVGGTWIQQQKIVISDGQPNDLLGRYDVVIDGDRAVIGAPSATVDEVNNKGLSMFWPERPVSGLRRRD